MAAYAGTASAAVTLVAEYHLGEAGSLSGTTLQPQDSAGTRHYTDRAWPEDTSPTVGTAGVYASGSTAYLDTSNPGNASWYGADFSTLPTDNFAFGIFVAAAENSGATQGDLFTLGGGTGALKLSLGGNGWASSANGASWIGQADGVSGSFAASTWVHLAIIRSAGISTFYIDGVAQAGTWGGTPVHDTSLLSVSPGGNPAFDGYLDEARVVTFDSGESTNNVMNALTAVPEPSAALLGTLGIFALLRRRTRA